MKGDMAKIIRWIAWAIVTALVVVMFVAPMGEALEVKGFLVLLSCVAVVILAPVEG